MIDLLKLLLVKFKEVLNRVVVLILIFINLAKKETVQFYIKGFAILVTLLLVRHFYLIELPIFRLFLAVNIALCLFFCISDILKDYSKGSKQNLVLVAFASFLVFLLVLLI